VVNNYNYNNYYYYNYNYYPVGYLLVEQYCVKGCYCYCDFSTFNIHEYELLLCLINKWWK